MQQLKASMLSSPRRRKRNDFVWVVLYSPAYLPLPMLQGKALNGTTSKGPCRGGKTESLFPFWFWQPQSKGSMLCMNTIPSYCNYLLIAIFLPTRKPVRTKNTCPTTALNGPVKGLLYAYFTNQFPELVKNLQSWENPITSLSCREKESLESLQLKALSRQVLNL